MNTKVFKSDLLLLIAAAIWGSAFVAQRVGLQFLGPFFYNSLRFGLGCMVLLPFVLFRKPRIIEARFTNGVSKQTIVIGTIMAGVLVFGGATFQQVGLITTPAGKAGFLTGLYVILVPIYGLFWRNRIHPLTGVGAILAMVGLYFLSATERFTITTGDIMVIACAFVWAGHVHLIGWMSPRVDSLRLAFTQFAICSFLSLILAVLFEPIVWQSVVDAAIPIIYAGGISVGIAYTLQIVGQRNAPVTHAAIIMSLEAVFAVLGGWLILGETLGPRGIAGCVLMLTGMLLSQFTREGPSRTRK